MRVEIVVREDDGHERTFAPFDLAPGDMLEIVNDQGRYGLVRRGAVAAIRWRLRKAERQLACVREQLAEKRRYLLELGACMECGLAGAHRGTCSQSAMREPMSGGGCR